MPIIPAFNQRHTLFFFCVQEASAKRVLCSRAGTNTKQQLYFLRSFNSLASKEEEEPQSKISSSRAEYKRLKRELMESKTEKTEKEESSTGMNTCMSIYKFSEDDWQFSPGSCVASASLGGLVIIHN